MPRNTRNFWATISGDREISHGPRNKADSMTFTLRYRENGEISGSRITIDCLPLADGKHNRITVYDSGTAILTKIVVR